MRPTRGDGWGVEIRDLRSLIPLPHRDRVGFCADTCHLYSAGYDLVNDFDNVWRQWDAVIGFALLECIHLNDSGTPFGSRRDRHALAKDIRAMRALVAKEKGEDDGWDLKLAAGGLVDIEFLAQYLVLAHAAEHSSAAP